MINNHNYAQNPSAFFNTHKKKSSEIKFTNLRTKINVQFITLQGAYFYNNNNKKN